MPLSDRNCALALLLATLAAAPQAGPPRGGDDVAALLERAARLLPPAQGALLARLLQPHAPGPLDKNARETLRERVEASGVFFEARLRLALQALPGASGEDLLQRLPPDIRTLLAEVMRAATPARNPVNGENEHASSLAAASTAPAGNELAQIEPAERAAAEAVLRRQAEAAYRWLNDGTFTFDLPARLPGEEPRVFIEFRREGQERGPNQPGRDSVLRFHVESCIFGPVGVEARWQGDTCDARVYVVNDAARTALENQAGSLRAALTSVFPRPNVEVVVNAARAAHHRSEPPPDPPPGGSVLSVRT